LDVAYASGFNGVEHFTYAFRNRYKYSPANYRKADPALSKKS
jgi:AraC-like DNA-binding protein